MEDGSKNTAHMVKVKKAKVEPSAKVKVMNRGTQSDKVTFVADLDYAGALKLARALGSKDPKVQAGAVKIVTNAAND